MDPYTNIAIITSLQPRKGLKQFVEILKNSKLKKIQYYLISQDDIQLDYLNVTHIKPKNDNDYVSALKRCHFILSTSTFEGFGLPLIEAMSYGTPVLTANNSSMPEVCGDAGLLVDAFDVNSIAEGLRSMILNKKLLKNLSNKARLNASRYSWDESSKKLLKVFEQAVMLRKSKYK